MTEPQTVWPYRTGNRVRVHIRSHRIELPGTAIMHGDDMFVELDEPHVFEPRPGWFQTSPPGGPVTFVRVAHPDDVSLILPKPED